jgi:hypothetical protein
MSKYYLAMFPIDYLYLILVAVLSNAGVDFLLVLVLNPKKASDKVKIAILEDDQFINAVIDRLVDPDILPKYDPIFDRLNDKIKGQALHSIGQEAILDKAINKEITQSMEIENPEIALALESIRAINPNLAKRLEKNPLLIPKAVEKLKQLGLLKNSSENNTKTIIYQ